MQSATASPGPFSAVAGSGQAEPAAPTAINIAWSSLPGQMRDIGVGGVDEQAVWAVGGESVPGGFEVSFWTGSAWDIVEGVGAVAIDVGPTGFPWIVTRENQIFEWTGADFVERPGQARDIGVGADGSVWMIGTKPAPGGYEIYRWTETSWEEVPGGAVAIDVLANGDLDQQRQSEPWIVDSDHHIARWTGSEWSRLPGDAQDIGIGSNGAIWIIGTTATDGGSSIATWNGAGWTTAGGGGSRISVSPDGFPFVVTDGQETLQGS
jgi:hypothetical protein